MAASELVMRLQHQHQEEEQEVFVERLNVLDFDKLDIIILNKFLRNLSYSVMSMQEELIRENKVSRINCETIRKRFKSKYVLKNLLEEIKTFGVVYNLNDNAIAPIKSLIKSFVLMLGITDSELL